MACDVSTLPVGYLPLTTVTLRRAAEFWAELRRQGLPTADARAIDADAILAAQALLTVAPGDTLVVATTHLPATFRAIQSPNRSQMKVKVLPW
jgi:hypothetical protein